MQFLYRLGVVVIGVPTFVVIAFLTWLFLKGALFPHHLLNYEQVRVAWEIAAKAGDMDAVREWASVARSISNGGVYAYQTWGDQTATIIFAIVGGLIPTAVVVLTWRWICGQTHPRTPLEKQVVRYARENLRQEPHSQAERGSTPQRRQLGRKGNVTMRTLPPDDPIFREGYRVSGVRRLRDLRRPDQEPRGPDEGEE